MPILERDEFIKPRTTLEGLATLKVAFDELGAMGFDAVALARYPQVERIEHVHTAGNSSGIVDGAAAVLIGSEAKGKRARPRRRARASSRPRCPAPTRPSCSPGRCRRRARRSPRPGLTIDDIDLFEVNEAFAAVPMRFMKRDGRAAREGQRQRRRDRDGPSARRDRRDARSARCSTSSSAAS